MGLTFTKLFCAFVLEEGDANSDGESAPRLLVSPGSFRILAGNFSALSRRCSLKALATSFGKLERYRTQSRLAHSGSLHGITYRAFFGATPFPLVPRVQTVKIPTHFPRIGRPRRSRQDYYPLQAKARRNCDYYPHNRYDLFVFCKSKISPLRCSSRFPVCNEQNTTKHNCIALNGNLANTQALMLRLSSTRTFRLLCGTSVAKTR